jgi:3-phenylpropionate/trans-cinnamate dioxygenase ferredoxin reductase component
VHGGPYVIVGGGAAGATCARTLLRAGREDVVLLTDEPARPYDRTTLSKRVLLDSAPPPDLYAADLPDGVVHTDRAAVGIDLAARAVVTAVGPLPFGTLVIATGAEPRRPPLPGIDAPHVLTLRSADDAVRLRATFEPGSHLLILGAGLIGLEVAAAAVVSGVRVTVVDVADRPMARLLPPELSALVEGTHRAAGVTLELDARPLEVVHGPDGPGLLLADGRRIDADHLLVATGVGPRTTLAEHAGLAVDDGILVDELLTTSHPDVLAAGDAVRVRAPGGDRGARTEAWTPAVAMGQHVGRTLLGEPSPYRDVPWAWSDQHDLQVQVAGDPLGGAETVTRGDPEGPEGRVVVALRAGRAVGVAGVGHGNGVGRAVRPIATLIGRGVPVTAAELADPSVDLRGLAQRSVE